MRFETNYNCLLSLLIFGLFFNNINEYIFFCSQFNLFILYKKTQWIIGIYRDKNTKLSFVDWINIEKNTSNVLEKPKKVSPSIQQTQHSWSNSCPWTSWRSHRSRRADYKHWALESHSTPDTWNPRSKHWLLQTYDHWAGNRAGANKRRVDIQLDKSTHMSWFLRLYQTVY